MLALNCDITTLQMSLEHGRTKAVHMESIFEPISIFNTFSNFFFSCRRKHAAISLLTSFFAEQKNRTKQKARESEREKEGKRNERTRLLLRISR